MSEGQPVLARLVAELTVFVKGDGGELRLLASSGDCVTLELVVDGDSCAECILPKAHLEAVALRRITEEVPSVRRVIIKDPRAE